MRGGKGQGGKAKLAANGLDQRAYYSNSLITRVAARQSYVNDSGVVRALCSGYSYYYNRHTYIYCMR
jgi:hypothetical protein